MQNWWLPEWLLPQCEHSSQCCFFFFFFSHWKLYQLLLFTKQELEPSFSTVPLAGQLERMQTGWLNFLKPISGQTLCSVFCRYCVLHLWEFAQIRGNSHQLWFFFFGSSHLFSVHVLCCALPVSVLITTESHFMKNVILLKHRGVGEAVSALSTFCPCLEGGLIACAVWKVAVDSLWLW